MPGCDADGNGEVSFDEAHAQALIAAETIDIPLKASDMLLRQFSRIPDYTLAADRARFLRGQGARPNVEAGPDSKDEGAKTLSSMSGTIESLLDGQSAATRRVVTSLCDQLQLRLAGDVSLVLDALREHRAAHRFGGPGRGGFGGPGGGPGRRSSRRELLAAITEKWPELGDPEKWKDAPQLKQGDQSALLEEIKALPAYETYLKRREEREKQDAEAEKHELKGVKYRRLVDTLESIVLAKNLAQVASPEINAGYQKMRKLEDSSLRPK